MRRDTGSAPVIVQLLNTGDWLPSLGNLPLERERLLSQLRPAAALVEVRLSHPAAASAAAALPPYGFSNIDYFIDF